MIAKRILSPKGGSGYQRLSGYVLNVRQEHRVTTDPASWTRLGVYILDSDHEGEKVAWARATNCGSDDPGWAVKGILATQEQNTRSKSDKSYHLVVSFPEGERPSRPQIEDIEDRLCAAMGFEEHQRVSAVHQNTDNWHLHVAINKVHPVSLRNVTPIRDHYRLQEACAELEIKHGLVREPHTVNPEQGRQNKARGRAADFEARHGGKSFLAWTQHEARAALVAAEGWQAVHQAAASYGLVIKPRGSGLVISSRIDGALHVKASDVDRGLSFKAMTDRHGPYKLPGQPVEAATARVHYERPARSGYLYEAFQAAKDIAVREREAATARLRTQHRLFARELADWYRDRMRRERSQPIRAALRREGLRHIAEQREIDRISRVDRERAERRDIRSANKVPNWQSWLEDEASKGNDAALKALRARQRRIQRIDEEILTAEHADQARHVVHQHMRPAIRQDGRVLYRTTDGGLVVDEAAQVRVTHVTTASAFLALTIAQDRFGDRPLVVRGTDDFRSQVARVAGIEGLLVTFADREMEGKRTASRAGLSKGVDQGHDPRDIKQPGGSVDRGGGHGH
jgi:hypothetical protein